MGTVEAGKLFLEALTCAGETADLNAAGNFDTTYAAQASCVQFMLLIYNCIYIELLQLSCSEHLFCGCNLLYSALNGLKDIRASSGCVLCTLPVTKRVQNRYNTLHGGCIGALMHTAHIIISPFPKLSPLAHFLYARSAVVGRLTARVSTLSVGRWPLLQTNYRELRMADGGAPGCVATLVDVVTSAALVTVSRRSGMSLSISVDYLSPGTGGEEVEVDARVRHPCNSLRVV